MCLKWAIISACRIFSKAQSIMTNHNTKIVLLFLIIQIFPVKDTYRPTNDGRTHKCAPTTTASGGFAFQSTPRNAVFGRDSISVNYTLSVI